MKRYLLVAMVFACTNLPVVQAQDKKLQLTEDEQKLLDLTNAEREKEKLPALKVNPMLCEAARAHSANMAKQSKMEHELDGKTPYDRIKAAGYKYLVAAENIARGRATSAKIMQGWMGSQLHRENIMDAEFTEIGIGLAKAENGDMYYTQVFAKPRK